MYRSIISLGVGILLLATPFDSHATECADQSAVTADGCVLSRPGYIYDSAYNGRDINGEDTATTAEATSVLLPTGFYQNKKITWTSNNLNPANIMEGISIFGIEGILNSSSTNTCALDGSALLAACNAPQNSFAYTRESGGRALDCTVQNGNEVTGPCYLATTGQTVRTEATPSACFTGGQVSKTCMVGAGGYRYTSAFGGRSLTCINGTNTAKCWLPVESATASVSNSCNENATNNGYNASSCKTLGTNRYVYSSAMGGRATDCADNDVGYCWITSAAKSGTASAMIPTNIKSGVSIFGVTGSYSGTPFTWGSGAHRLKNLTTAERRTYTYESGLSTGTNLPTPYHPVPKIATSTDGHAHTAAVSPVDRTNWNSLECGTTGTIADRVANCVTVLNGRGTGSTWEGEKRGNAGQTTWRLVTRASGGGGNFSEVWQDTATGLLWSSLVSGAGLNWCKASGNSYSQKVAPQLQDNDPFNICNQNLYQSVGNNNAISACYEGPGFSATGTDPGGKGGLNIGNGAGSGKVAWRLPTIHDYILANHHGLRFVMPDIWTQGEEWTATVFSKDRSKAWTFDGATGTRQVRERGFARAARCVGR